MEPPASQVYETARPMSGRAGKAHALDWYVLVFELIDMRSFSNLWYWISLAVVWSSASHWVLGVPFDMLTRARRKGGQAEIDFEQMVRINVNRLNYIDGVAGLWLLALSCFFLTVLGTLGFWYRIQFAQAVFLIAAPLTIVGALSLRMARRLDSEPVAGEDLRHRLVRHRFLIQFIGMIAIFVTAMWGMYQNMSGTILR